MLRSLLLLFVLVTYGWCHGNTVWIYRRNGNVNINRVFANDKSALGGPGITGCFFEGANFDSTVPEERTQAYPLMLQHEVNRLVVKLTPGIFSIASLFISTFSEPAQYQVAPVAVSISRWVGQAQTIDILLPGPQTYYIAYVLGEGGFVESSMQHGSMCYSHVAHRVCECENKYRTEFFTDYDSCKLDMRYLAKRASSTKVNQLKIKFSSKSELYADYVLPTMNQFAVRSDMKTLYMTYDKNTEYIYLMHKFAGDVGTKIYRSYDLMPKLQPPTALMGDYSTCLFVGASLETTESTSQPQFTYSVRFRYSSDAANLYVQLKQIASTSYFNTFLIEGIKPSGSSQAIYSNLIVLSPNETTVDNVFTRVLSTAGVANPSYWMVELITLADTPVTMKDGSLCYSDTYNA